MPVVVREQSDRLPLTINKDKPTDAEKVDVVYVQPSEQGQAIRFHQYQKNGSYTTSRDYFSSLADRHDAKAKTERRRASSTNQTKTGSVDPSQHKLAS